MGRAMRLAARQNGLGFVQSLSVQELLLELVLLRSDVAFIVSTP
jgi:hypothetical protein